MAQGQMQLSMEETKERMGRDKRAIQWLLDNLTGDAEIESFTMSIPGSFNGEWSFEVWTGLSKFKEGDVPAVTRPSTGLRTVLGLFPRQLRTWTAGRSPTDAMIHGKALHSPNTGIHRPIFSTSIHKRNTIRELCRRIGHLSDTCRNRAAFASDELWRRRFRACVEAGALLVCYANAEPGWFGDILRTLGDIGSWEGICNLPLAGKDQTFVVHWTCLSILAFQGILSGNVLYKEHARLAVESFGELRHAGDRTDEAANKNAREIDNTLDGQWAAVKDQWRDVEAQVISGITWSSPLDPEISSVVRTMRNIDDMQTFPKICRLQDC
jgi:hypothetical protein